MIQNQNTMGQINHEATEIKTKESVSPEAALSQGQIIGPEQVKNFTKVLEKYKAGKVNTEQRILASENWWKLRNTTEEAKDKKVKDGDFHATSGWLHNVIVSKHADAMESYPEPNILPREQGDRGEANLLSAIIPCIIEQNGFETTYSDEQWQKLKTGTGVYKVIWDISKLNGLGDIGIERCNLLNIYWEPGIADIQKSRYFFHTELYDKDILEQLYPDLLKDKLKGKTFMSTKFLYDDHVDTENKVTVIEVYYHKHINGKQTLQYCKYVNDIVLYATENDVQKPVSEQVDPMTGGVVLVEGASVAERGLYDHGKYPYVFDALYPIEGSPCGYGYVDICRNPQTVIDLLNTSFVKNAMVGATPRYFKRKNSGVNEGQFLDLTNPLVEVTSLDEASLRRIEHDTLDSNYIAVLDRTIQELRETSGNTETSTGNISSGVTAASAIAALQEASGKGSKDSTMTSYRAYGLIVSMCIELIRQFYDMPRNFRIVGQYGMEQYISYSNANLQPQHQGYDFGKDMGYRLPVFDIKISAQKKNVYTKISQNELATQFFQLGFFNPQLTDQTLLCLEMMDFDGKDEIMQKVAKNGTMFQKLVQYMQMALAFAQVVRPDMVEAIAQDLMQTMGTAGGGGAAMSAQQFNIDHINGLSKGENTRVENARARSQEASQPDGGRVTRKSEGNK